MHLLNFLQAARVPLPQRSAAIERMALRQSASTAAQHALPEHPNTCIIQQVITPCLQREAVVGFNSQVLDLRPGNLRVAEALEPT